MTARPSFIIFPAAGAWLGMKIVVSGDTALAAAAAPEGNELRNTHQN